jgi:hypothetical protein
MSGKSARQEDDNKLQSFLRTIAVIYKLAWLVSCTYNRHATIPYICDSVSCLSGEP